MAYNTKALLVDAKGKPIPQYYNEVLDVYEPVTGSNGYFNGVIVDSSGQPITQQFILDSWTTNANAIISKLDELILVVS